MIGFPFLAYLWWMSLVGLWRGLGGVGLLRGSKLGEIREVLSTHCLQFTYGSLF